MSFDAVNATLLLTTDSLILLEGATLHYLYQANNLELLTFTTDGNLCLYNDGGYAVWCSHPGGMNLKCYIMHSFMQLNGVVIMFTYY